MSALRQRPLLILLRGLWLLILLGPFAPALLHAGPFAPALLQGGAGDPGWWHEPGRWGVALAYLLLAMLAWPIFQQASTRGQILWLGCIGSVLLLLRSLLTGGESAAAVALVAYMAVGLGLLGSLSVHDAHPEGAAQREGAGTANRVAGLFLVGLMAAGALSSTWPGFRLPSHSIPLQSGRAPLGGPPEGMAGAAGTPDSLARISMSRSVSLSDTPVLTIAGAPAVTTPTYWAMATYDNFDGQAWTAPAGAGQSAMAPAGSGQAATAPAGSGQAATTPAGSGQSATAPAWSGQSARAGGLPTAAPNADPALLSPAITGFPTREWQVTVHRLTTADAPLIYTGTPVGVNAPASGEGGTAAVTVQPGLRALWAPGAADYTLRLRVPELDPAALQQAALAPASAELQPDLALPPDLSPDVAALARTITGDATAPWQAAQAVADYLRVHETYTTQFSLPRGNVVNAFLLDSHQGYCDQFATSFIILMRTLSVPARWVMGFKVGPDDRTANQFLVRARNAHSWAEVYIAPYGWIPVDPTPGGDPIPSYTAGGGPAVQTPGPSGTPGTLPPQGAPQTPAAPVPDPAAQSGWIHAAAVLGVLVLAIAAVLQLRRRGRAALAGRRTQRLWRDLTRLAEGRATSLPTAPVTPRELLALLPAAERAPMIPVVQLLERAWYGEERLAAAEIAAAEAALHSVISAGLRRRT